MNIRTTYRLRKLSARGNIDRGFKIALKKRLLAQKDVVKSPHRLLKPLAVGMTMLLVFGMTTGAYAYGSKSVLPDHPLYGVRAQIERVESAIVSGNPQKRADVAIKHLERRVLEIDLMEGNEDQIKEKDVERVSQAVKEAMDVAAETEETENRDRKIRQAEMKGTQLFQRASERNDIVKNAVDKSVKDIGRVVWKMDESRRARYENIELRYEAELFGMDWKLENGHVVVNDDEKDIDAVMVKLSPESVQEVMASSDQLTDIEDAKPENTAREDSDDGANVAFGADRGEDAVTDEQPYDWHHADDEEKARNGWNENGFDDGIVRARIRNYFERLRLQQ